MVVMQHQRAALGTKQLNLNIPGTHWWGGQDIFEARGRGGQSIYEAEGRGGQSRYESNQLTCLACQHRA